MSGDHESTAVFGVCTNKDCSYCQSKQVISADPNNFVCPGCWKPLSRVSGGNGEPRGRKKIWIAAAVILLVIVLGGAVAYLLNREDTPLEVQKVSQSNPIEVDTVAIDTYEFQDVSKRIKEEDKLVVGMEYEAPPMNYFDGDCRRGFDYELAKLLRDYLEVNDLLIREFSYDELPGALLNGEIDLMMGGYVKDTTLDDIIWSNVYLEFGLCLITKKGSPYPHYGALNNKRIAFYEGDAIPRNWIVENLTGVELDSSNVTGWLKMVSDGSVDAAIYDYPYAKEEILEFPDLNIIEFNLNESGYNIGISEGNDKLQREVNRFILSLEPGGTLNDRYSQLVHEYLKAEETSVKVESKLTGGCQSPYCHKVRPGETLSSIAQNKLGSGARWRDIYRENMGRVANPNLIIVGMELKMPN